MIAEDYPKNFQEFIARFQTEDNCWSYLYECVLDEYAFRFNRKLSKHRGKIFYRLIQQDEATQPMTLKKIIKN